MVSVASREENTQASGDAARVPRTRIFFYVRFSSDFTRLPQMESLLAH